MENKSCMNCYWNNGLDPICRNFERIGRRFSDYDCWKPKEEVKEMGKIQMTEEEWRDFLKKNLKHCYSEGETIDETMKILKYHGYIKKSPLEIAREEYESFSTNAFDENMYQMKLSEKNILAENLINELEKEIERLKNEKNL